MYAVIENYLREKRPLLTDEVIAYLEGELNSIEEKWRDVIMDYSRPILHQSDETGEIIYGGHDNPIANKRRAELNERRRTMLKERYNRDSK